MMEKIGGGLSLSRYWWQDRQSLIPSLVTTLQCYFGALAMDCWWDKRCPHCDMTHPSLFLACKAVMICIVLSFRHQLLHLKYGPTRSRQVTMFDVVHMTLCT